VPFSRVILLGNGPLPLKAQFTFESTDQATLFVSGSAYAAVPNQTIGVNIAIDTQPVSSVTLYTNEANSHKSLVTAPVVINPGFGKRLVTRRRRAEHDRGRQ
jgi:hypothetical protein